MGLSLRPEDIDIIETGGMLDGQEVKLLRSRGGFWMAANYKGVLAAGSHPAIVKHQLSKMFPKFQPAMCKSEAFADALVEKHSHFLSDELRKSGHDIYSIQDGADIEFQITKHNLKVASLQTYLNNDELHIPNISFPKEFSNPLAGATTEKALSCKAKTIKVK
jgi:hypothetical protein